MRCLDASADTRVYDFHCPSCGETGDLGLGAHDAGIVGCPANCGAAFYEYRAPDGWRLGCIVQPVFEKPEVIAVGSPSE